MTVYDLSSEIPEKSSGTIIHIYTLIKEINADIVYLLFDIMLNTQFMLNHCGISVNWAREGVVVYCSCYL
jgi:hypothetical protein